MRQAISSSTSAVTDRAEANHRRRYAAATQPQPPSSRVASATSTGEGPVWIAMCPRWRFIEGSCGIRRKRNIGSGTIEYS